MAIKNISLEDFPSFGRRLMELAQEKNIGSPLLLAEALYTNYQELVKPAQRKNKHGKIVKDKEHDIEAIRRMVQNHFNEENAFNIQSKYIYAYSKLFNCSTDYLYGIVPVKNCDLEIQDICKKLHLSEESVQNLIDGYDPDPTVIAPTRCWSDILSGETFSNIPYAWFMHCMVVSEYEDLSKKIEAIKKAEAFATDDTYRTMMEVRRIALEKMQPGKMRDCVGSFINLAKLIYDYIDFSTKTWVNSQHSNISDSYYDNEIKKIEMLETALKENS